MSWPGVILRAPVPNSGSTASSAMMGIGRSMMGSSALRPTIFCQRSARGLTATATSATIVSGRVVAITMYSSVTLPESSRRG